MDHQGDQPYCSNCGYQLTGLTESSKCPECGRPLVEVLVRGRSSLPRGKRYASALRIFGVPLIHVALGPTANELRGHARGIIAIGDMATGVLALGGLARGVIAVGGLALGLVSLGGGAIGLMVAVGGGAVGGLSLGGGAVGVVAKGGAAVGVIADGGGAFGVIARGGQTGGRYTAPSWPRGTPPHPKVTEWYWLIGAQPGSPVFALWAAGLAAAVIFLAALIVALGYAATRSRPPPR